MTGFARRASDPAPGARRGSAGTVPSLPGDVATSPDAPTLGMNRLASRTLILEAIVLGTIGTIAGWYLAAITGARW